MLDFVNSIGLFRDVLKEGKTIWGKILWALTGFGMLAACAYEVQSLFILYVNQEVGAFRCENASKASV